EAIEDGVNGYLIPIKNGKLDKEVFLNRASCLSKEPSLCIKLGEDGRDKFLRLFTNERTVQQYIEMLETMLA
ncbi:MAG: hypothetical protein NT148_01925, partial [Candidatus Nealsonbacteria bacterium]|nr:hypothetical protein [Candidatus Nealsonbacteria bacterium]